MAWFFLFALLGGPAARGVGAVETAGWKPTALPLLSFSSDEGAGYGLRISLFGYDGETAPYARAFSLQVFSTTRGRKAHRLYLDLPRFRPGERLEAELLYEEQEYANFYGDLGDQGAERLLAGVPPEERQRLTTFGQVYPRLMLMWLRQLRPPWQWRLGAQLGHCRISPNAGPASLLARLNPKGMEGGLLMLGNTALRRDTRDDYNDSRRGTLAELLLELGGEVQGKNRGGRLSLDHRYFLPLPWGLVLARRTTATLVLGDLPFYEYPALGGDDTVRGLLEARERGEGRLLANLELRWPGFSPLSSLPLRGGLLCFLDAGQTFRIRSGPSLRGWRTGVGLGGRGHWHGTIVRGDLGYAAGRLAVYLKFSQVF